MSQQEFWEFCKERENIRKKKEAGEERPWTNDDILDRHKFTNINRQHDRGTVLLNETIKNFDAFDKIFAIIVYRFSGSLNDNLNQIISKYPSTQWCSQLKSQTKLVNTSAYQANWGAGKGKGLEFVHTHTEDISRKLYHWLQSGFWTIDEVAQKICDFCNESNYPRMYFQATESSKDIAHHFKNVDEDSECNMGPGAIKGLKYIGFTGNRTHAIKTLLESDSNPNYNYSILEHALCEYSKWKDYKAGVRKSTNKIYQPHKE